MRGAWSALQVRLVPILILYWCGIHCAAMTADSIFMLDDEPDWVAAASAAGLFRKRRGVPSQQVVTYAFGDKHCFRNYPLQEMAV